MSLLADLVESLRQKLAEANSSATEAHKSFLNWHREADKEFYSVLQKPDSSEQDIFNARKKLDDEEGKKRKLELEPAYEKRDQIKKDLDSKIEWLNKGYEIFGVSPTTDAEEPETKKPSKSEVGAVSPATDAEEPETKKPSKPQTGAVSTAESGADGKSSKGGATGKAFTTPGYHGDLNGKSGKAGSDGKAGKSALKK